MQRNAYMGMMMPEMQSQMNSYFGNMYQYNPYMNQQMYFNNNIDCQ